MPTEQDIRHQHELLDIYRRNVQHYLRQAAAHGGELLAPPIVRHGLHEARQQIAQIKQNLRGWGKTVTDLPTDTEASPAQPIAEQTAAAAPPAVLAEPSLNYDRTQQPWYVDGPPAIQRLPRAEATQWQDQMQVLLLTVNDNEFFAVGRLLQPLPLHECVRQVTFDNETYYLGRYGVYNTVVAKSRMGSAGPGAAMLATKQAQDRWKPRATIAVGVAFGMDPDKQKLGDVLIAREIIPYNPIRAGAVIIERGQRLAADVALFNRFDNAYDWEFRLPDGQLSRLHQGAVLSGEELIDNAARKAELVQRFPEAIGGEMEGTGLSGASFYERRPWILVKAICDWADGVKNAYHQPLAAAAAASLVHHVLSDPDAISEDGWMWRAAPSTTP